MKLKNVLKVGLPPFCAFSLLACTIGGQKSAKVTVTFKNYDGKVLQTETIQSGEDAAFKQEELPKKPVEKGSGVFVNKFIGWNKSLNNIKENTVFTAEYKAIDNTYKDKDHDGMPEGVDLNDDPKDPECNVFTYGAKSMVYFENQEIKIDFSKFLDGDNTKYDNDIAKLGLLMSNPKADFNDSLFNEKAYGGRVNALYSRLGCDDFHHFDFKDEAAKTYKYDPNDTTSGVYGHKYLTDSNGKVQRDLIFIAFEGTNGPRRWASNFDVGYDDGTKDENYNKDYYEKTKRTDAGEKGTREDHPEWDNYNFHKGFYIAAHRVLDNTVDGGTKEGPVKFLEYIKNHTTDGLDKPIVFVTGHSRGGAMATIVGDYLERLYKENDEPLTIPFTYAFAAPSVWGGLKTNESKPDDQTIFNVINDDDLVTKVPFSEWGFDKLGHIDFVEPVSKYKDQYDKNKSSRSYQNIDPNIQESIFHNLGCKGRDNIYKFSEEPELMYQSIGALNDSTFYDEDEAKEELKNLKEYYRNNLGDFFNFIDLFIEKSEDLLGRDIWNIYSNCCLGTVTALIQKLMTKDSKIMDHIIDVLPLINNGPFIEMILSLGIQIVPEGADKIALPHDYGSYTILLKNYQPKP